MIVGRERERAAVDSFVAARGDGPRALILEGERGIGKTTLFRHALDAEERRAIACVRGDRGTPRPRGALALFADASRFAFPSEDR